MTDDARRLADLRSDYEVLTRERRHQSALLLEGLDSPSLQDVHTLLLTQNRLMETLTAIASLFLDERDRLLRENAELRGIPQKQNAGEEE